MPKRKKQFKIYFNASLALKLIPILILIAFVWYFRPWFHGIFILFYTNPIFVEIIVVWYLFHRFVLRRKKKFIQIETETGTKEMVDISYMFYVFFSVSILVALMSGGMLFAYIMPQVHVVNELDYKSIYELPETKENIRLMPLEVAYRYSRDSLQLSQYKLGTENIALVNDDMAWIFPLIPDGSIIQFTLKNRGMVYVDATTQERNSKMVEKSLQTGEGMLIFDNLWWNIYKNKYNINLDDPYYLPYNGDVYTVVSVISYSFHNYFGLLYTVPRFGGVFLTDSAGNINLLTPDEAKENPVLEDNRLFPEGLARFYTESYKYNRGVINRFIIHEDQIEIRDVSTFSTSNRQPFLMSTDEGLKWFVSTEPQGESHGIFKIFLVDAITGDIELYELPIEETLTGPVKAMDFVRRENPIVDWTMFKLVEPLPFITDSILYWKVVVVPNDAAGIAYQAFVNTKTNDVVQVGTDEEIKLFVQSGIATAEEPQVEEETQNVTIKEIKEKLKELEGLIEKLEQ